MAAETITVYIDPAQLALQKTNNYSLYLAKKVNGQFTVIWQSQGPVATAGNPAYGYRNTFSIAVPNYEVNYGTVSTVDGSVTFQTGGDAQSIAIGQQTVLSALGLFGAPTNDGTPGDIIINNQLQDNPNAILLDNAGNPIFVNTESGMDIGVATITPIDTYQIWFDNYQDTGTIISHQVSNFATVVFAGGETDQTISYDKSGAWVPGPLSSAAELADAMGADTPADLSIAVLATFKYALTLGAATYLVHKLIDKFTAGLRPTKITAQAGSAVLTVEFAGPEAQKLATLHGLSKFEEALNLALKQARTDPSSGLQQETWSISEPTMTASY